MNSKEKTKVKEKSAPKALQRGKYGVFQGSLVRNNTHEKTSDTLLTEDYNEEDLTITKIDKNNKAPTDYIELNSGEISRKKVKIKGPLIFRITIYLIIALIAIAVLLLIIFI